MNPELALRNRTEFVLEWCTVDASVVSWVLAYRVGSREYPPEASGSAAFAGPYLARLEALRFAPICFLDGCSHPVTFEPN